MRCFKCGVFTPFAFCGNCKSILSEPTIGTRELLGLRVYHFYNYSEISDLLYSKHKMHGKFIYNALSRLSFKPFASKFTSEVLLNAVPIDDKNLDGYSHTAILAHSLKSDFIKPIFNVLKAQNSVSYSGKDLKFRQENPRNFRLLKHVNQPVILVDDIITTGTTLLEAKDVLEKNGINVLCGIVLADARY